MSPIKNSNDSSNAAIILNEKFDSCIALDVDVFKILDDVKDVGRRIGLTVYFPLTSC